MRRKQGFTLVELLVVMAIIAILAAIVVPNASRFIARARVTRALSEVAGMETAITAMVTDANKSNVGQLFNRAAVPQQCGIDATNWNNLPASFNTVMTMYSNVIYDMLKNGRNAITSGESNALAVVDKNVLAKLGTNYMDVGNDPWGESYIIFPGPWKSAPVVGGSGYWPIIFRKFSVETGNSGRQPKDDGYALINPDRPSPVDPSLKLNWVRDSFSGIVDDAETWPDRVGYPADKNKSVYIWSMGANMRSSQIVYKAAYDVSDPFDWFTSVTTGEGPQEGADLGGGDDINNWDKDATWARFTN